jgi:hypothetical protein
MCISWRSLSASLRSLVCRAHDAQSKLGMLGDESTDGAVLGKASGGAESRPAVAASKLLHASSMSLRAGS